jgi:hypothetical protein
MDEAIQKIAEANSYTYTDVVLDFLRQELAVMGYTMGIGRDAGEDLQASRIIEKRVN